MYSITVHHWQEEGGGLRGLEVTRGGVEQAGEEGGGLVEEEEDFKVYLLFDGEPVEVLEHRGDVVSGVGVGEQAGSRALDVLQFAELF